MRPSSGVQDAAGAALATRTGATGAIALARASCNRCRSCILGARRRGDRGRGRLTAPGHRRERGRDGRGPALAEADRDVGHAEARKRAQRNDRYTRAGGRPRRRPDARRLLARRSDPDRRGLCGPCPLGREPARPQRLPDAPHRENRERERRPTAALRRRPAPDDIERGFAAEVEIVAAQQRHRRVGALVGAGEADMAFVVMPDLAVPARPLDAPIVVELDAAGDDRPLDIEQHRHRRNGPRLQVMQRLGAPIADRAIGHEVGRVRRLGRPLDGRARAEPQLGRRRERALEGRSARKHERERREKELDHGSHLVGVKKQYPLRRGVALVENEPPGDRFGRSIVFVLPKRFRRDEPVEAAEARLHGCPILDVEIDHGEPGRRIFLRHAGEGVAVAMADEECRQVLEAGIVADEEERADRRLDLADDGEQALGRRLVDRRLEARRHRAERRLDKLPGLSRPARRGDEGEVGKELLSGKMRRNPGHASRPRAASGRSMSLVASGEVALPWRRSIRRRIAIPRANSPQDAVSSGRCKPGEPSQARQEARSCRAQNTGGNMFRSITDFLQARRLLARSFAHHETHHCRPSHAACY